MKRSDMLRTIESVLFNFDFKKSNLTYQERADELLTILERLNMLPPPPRHTQDNVLEYYRWEPEDES